MLEQNAMVQTPMLSTMTFKIAEVNTVKEVEPNIIQDDTNDYFLSISIANSLPTVPPSGALDFTPDFKWGSCYSIFSFMYDAL
jgi:hypothetical protein